MPTSTSGTIKNVNSRPTPSSVDTYVWSFIVARSVSGDMSSLAVTLAGTDPLALSCVFFPTLELAGGEWYVEMLDFTAYNFIANVSANKNNLFPVRSKTIETSWIPMGAYEIDESTRF